MKWIAAMCFLLAAPAWAGSPRTSLPRPPACKKMCSAKLQPCGNGCISKKLTCRKPPGTACASN